MISYTETLIGEELGSLPETSLTVRIEAMYKAYGTGFDFLDFWLQRRDGELTAVLCRFSKELWLSASDGADFEELSAFCKAIAPTVLTDTATAQKLGFEATERFYEQARVSTVKQEPQSVNVSRLYELLMQGADGDISIPDKNEWYADVSHRLRHGTATAALFENSVALAGFVGEKAALVTGVVVSPEARGKGEGAKALLQLVGSLYPRRIFVESTEKTASFYKKCGFVKTADLCRCNIQGGKKTNEHHTPHKNPRQLLGQP